MCGGLIGVLDYLYRHVAVVIVCCQWLIAVYGVVVRPLQCVGVATDHLRVLQHVLLVT